jgi:signal transduction histidine kinase
MPQKLNKQKFSRLGIFYILALSGIAGVIIISQILIQGFIAKQRDDSHIINVAGRQRMLSQRICKIVLQIQDTLKMPTLQKLSKDFDSTLNLWVRSHKELLSRNQSERYQSQNSPEIVFMFRQIQPHYDLMVKHSRYILSYMKVLQNTDYQEVVKNRGVILANENAFLRGMDSIVFQYDKEAQQKIYLLSSTEIYLLILSLVIIIFEVIFIFIPTSRKVQETMTELINSEIFAKKMTLELSGLYNTLEKSYEKLSDVEVETETSSLLGKIDKLGNFTYISEKLVDYLTWEYPPQILNFFEYLTQEGYENDFIESLKTLIVQENSWNGEIKLTTEEGDFIWLQLNIISTYDAFSNQYDYLIIGTNITELKEAKQRAYELNKAKIEEAVKEKQFRSVLILEGQEEERRRIARDIHDGIGQMLAALRMNLDSIPYENSQNLRYQLRECQEVLRNIIKETRRVAFNLIPSSLGDFGIVPSVKKFCSQVSELMGIQISFVNKTGFINRLDKNVETHLYRIVQEGVNNAIKYSKSNKIMVSFSHNFYALVVEIADNGIGFDYEKLAISGYFAEAGHGIFNMRERTEFIEGRFELETAPGQGTKIKVTIPLNTN